MNLKEKILKIFNENFQEWAEEEAHSWINESPSTDELINQIRKELQLHGEVFIPAWSDECFEWELEHKMYEELQFPLKKEETKMAEIKIYDRKNLEKIEEVLDDEGLQFKFYKKVADLCNNLFEKKLKKEFPQLQIKFFENYKSQKGWLLKKGV